MNIIVSMNTNLIRNRGGEISKMYSCPRTTGCQKALGHTKALLACTQINTKARSIKMSGNTGNI